MRRLLLAVALLGLALPAGLDAQLAFETPRLLGPETPRGLGVHWVRAGTLPGDGNALLVTLSSAGLPEAITLRGGTGTGAAGGVSAFGGVDVRVPLASRGPGRPVDFAFTAGAGVGVGDYVMFTVPVGVSAGRSWSSGAVWIAPYVAAGLAVDVRTGGGGPGAEQDAFGVSPSADLGVDFSLDSGRRFVVRASTSLGDRQAVAAGVMVRLGG